MKDIDIKLRRVYVICPIFSLRTRDGMALVRGGGYEEKRVVYFVAFRG